MTNLINKKNLLIASLIVIGSVALFLIFKINIDTEASVANEELPKVAEVTTTKTTKKTINVDIKGEVKKPGVYNVEEGAIVNDCIKLAGGLTKSASTKNINLSKKVSDEMVIYVFKKSEVTTSIKNEIACTTQVVEVNNCVNPEQPKKEDEKVDNKVIDKVNINTASKEELMTLSGVGESKANAIIEYRKTSLFKTIEDIKNVSGIGDSMYEKIKDNIIV